jgi:hypothetical protein
MASTVYIEVQVRGISVDLDGNIEPLTEKWTGSGVVLRRNKGTGHSLVLSANHVLQTPPIGKVFVHPDKIAKVLGVAIKVRGHGQNGKECSLVVTKLSGDSELNDLGLGEAQCDVGTPVELGRGLPPLGALVTAVGHPRGIPATLVSAGYYSGPNEDGFLVSSNAIAGGSSGGGLFADGALVGIIVRGRVDFEGVALSVPVERVKAFLQ